MFRIVTRPNLRTVLDTRVKENFHRLATRYPYKSEIKPFAHVRCNERRVKHPIVATRKRGNELKTSVTRSGGEFIARIATRFIESIIVWCIETVETENFRNSGIVRSFLVFSFRRVRGFRFERRRDFRRVRVAHPRSLTDPDCATREVSDRRPRRRFSVIYY